MLRKTIPLFWLLVFAACSRMPSSRMLVDQAVRMTPDSISLVDIESDTLFNSHQSIHILVLPKQALPHYRLEMTYSPRLLEKTSWFGKKSLAVAAINGGFFDMDSGGSVTYLEVGDSVINGTQPDVDSLKWAFPDSLINGAVILTNNSQLLLRPVQPQSVYENSHVEAAVLVAGPLLLQGGQRYPLPNSNFVTHHHPRSYLATTPTAILLIAVDGRSESAGGMTLLEAQTYLLRLGCIDAINLDGGGSTSLWVRTQGIVNHPSDTAGERPVANAIIIVRR